ncbi:MAG: hypothetical protein D6691_11190 [Candidatus Hydrogenedentota bacterium]|nr:MAG: hypothetical protein D6691_11190 [Candidatus Hydrogenedentota bacterium]GIX43864.1 MAG: hypothetical protein KatS3mg130_0272 [Candidatus Sumerlaea sp.]
MLQGPPEFHAGWATTEIVGNCAGMRREVFGTVPNSIMDVCPSVENWLGGTGDGRCEGTFYPSEILGTDEATGASGA